MQRIKLLKLSQVAILSLAVIVSACGSSSSSDSDSDDTQAVKQFTGKFVDSEVSGLEYTCSSGSTGVTTDKGEFTCNESDSVTFYLNASSLGSSEMQDIMTPMSIASGNKTVGLNIARLLQTLDSDNNLENGITISSELLDKLENIDFDSSSFAEDIQAQLGNDISLVPETEAQAHLDDTYEELGITEDGTPKPEDEPTAQPTGQTEQTVEGTITSSVTGKVWMDRNLGASQVCTASNDTACYGDYYQWGRAADGHEKVDSSTTTVQSIQVNPHHSHFIIGEDWTSADDDGAIRSANWNICPTGFRVPTMNELEAENITSTSDAFNKLKIPSAGNRSYDASSMDWVGLEADLWSNTVDDTRTRAINFYNYGANSRGNARAYGFSIRCIENRSDFRYTTEWLNGRTLYNVLCEDGPCELSTFTFTDTKWSVTEDTEEAGGLKDQNYTISSEGYIAINESEYIYSYKQNADYHTICWDTMSSITSCDDDSEFFFFDEQKARDFIASQGGN